MAGVATVKRVLGLIGMGLLIGFVACTSDGIDPTPASTATRDAGIETAETTPANGTNVRTFAEPKGVLAFAAGGAIYTVQADGGQPTEVVKGTRSVLPDAESEHDAFLWAATPSFSPDEAYIVFTRDFDLWLADPATGETELLANVGDWQPAAGASNYSLGAQTPVWSPDGTRIAYVVARIGGSGVNELWTLDVETMARQRLAQVGAGFLSPVWLDAERVGIFEGERLRVFNATTGDEASAIEMGELGSAAESASVLDGAWVSGSFVEPGPIMYGEPGATATVAEGVAPVLSPDGDWIAYFTEDEIRLVTIAGTDDHPLADLTAFLGRDLHHASACALADGAPDACSYRPPQLSWVALPAVTPPPQTGVPTVDAVIEAVRAGDADTLAGMVEFSDIECRPADRPGYAPLCPDLGLAPGETFAALPSGTCDASYVFPGRVEEFFARLVDEGGAASVPFGAYERTADGGRQYVAMFVAPGSGGENGFWRFALDENRIVSATFSCGDSVPQDVTLYLVRPSDLGHEPSRKTTVPDQAGRVFNALAAAGLEADPRPGVLTLPWMHVDGVPIEGHRLLVANEAEAGLFDLRSEAAQQAVREAAQGALPAPLVEGDRAVWVGHKVAVVLWDREAHPEIEETITFVLGEPALAEGAE